MNSSPKTALSLASTLSPVYGYFRDVDAMKEKLIKFGEVNRSIHSNGWHEVVVCMK
jgi:hypothetical protein